MISSTLCSLDDPIWTAKANNRIDKD